MAVRLRGRLDKEDRLLGPVKLERSIPVKGTQLRKGLPAPPPNITPPFVSNYYSTFVTTGSLPLKGGADVETCSSTWPCAVSENIEQGFDLNMMFIDLLIKHDFSVIVICIGMALRARNYTRYSSCGRISS